MPKDDTANSLYRKIRIDDYSALVDRVKELSYTSNQFLFSGAMGSGKTTMIKEICMGFGVEDNISSPTFSLVNEYRTENSRIIYHFDLSGLWFSPRRPT